MQIKNLEHVEVVEGECQNCLYYTECGAGRSFALCRAIIGRGTIFTKKEVWEWCTKENTSVGDTVRYYHTGAVSSTVKYIHETKDKFLLDDHATCADMTKFKVKVR